MITRAQRAEIRRLSYAEHWKIGYLAYGALTDPPRAVERPAPGRRTAGDSIATCPTPS
jgi:hypothetical protein